MGRSDLWPREAARVAKANALARLTAKVIDWAHARGLSWCLENPERSLMWDIPDLIKVGQLHGAMATCYDACAHGGQRKKAQKLLHNLVELDNMRARCQGGHVHLPWVPLYERRKFAGFSSHLEAEYPELFCDRYMECFAAAYSKVEPSIDGVVQPGSAEGPRRRLQ